MNVEVVDALSEQDRQQLLGWATDLFGTAALHQWGPKHWQLIRRQDGLAVAKVSVLRHTIVVGDSLGARPLVGGRSRNSKQVRELAC